MGHQQGLREATGLQKFEIHTIHHRGQAQEILQIPAAFIRHQRHRTLPMQISETLTITFRVRVWSEWLLKQNNAASRQGLQHSMGLIPRPATVGIHLQLDGNTPRLGAGLDRFSHRLQQVQIVIQPIRAAELELHPSRGKLRPPAFQTIQNLRHSCQAQGDAGGNTCPAVEPPEPP